MVVVLVAVLVSLACVVGPALAELLVVGVDAGVSALAVVSGAKGPVAVGACAVWLSPPLFAAS